MFQKTFSSSCSYQLLGLKLGNGSTPAQATTKAAWRDFKRPLRVEATTKVSLSHSLSLSNLLSILLPFLISLSLSLSQILQSFDIFKADCKPSHACSFPAINPPFL